MTTPRHMRRQARKLHRSGIQPIVVIGDSQGPEITGLVLFRLTWRYRSELAPSFLAA